MNLSLVTYHLRRHLTYTTTVTRVFYLHTIENFHTNDLHDSSRCSIKQTLHTWLTNSSKYVLNNPYPHHTPSHNSCGACVSLCRQFLGNQCNHDGWFCSIRYVGPHRWQRIFDLKHDLSECRCLRDWFLRHSKYRSSRCRQWLHLRVPRIKWLDGITARNE